MTSGRRCDVCGAFYYDGSCPNEPHDWVARVDAAKNRKGRRPERSARARHAARHSDVDEWSTAKKRAIERSGGACVVCGTSEAPLHPHHTDRKPADVDDPASTHDKHNLVALCGSCHRKVEAGEEEVPPGY